MAGIPAHLAAGTNKVVNGTGTLVAALEIFSQRQVLLRPAVTAAVCSSARLCRHGVYGPHLRADARDADARGPALRGCLSERQKGLRAGHFPPRSVRLPYAAAGGCCALPSSDWCSAATTGWSARAPHLYDPSASRRCSTSLHRGQLRQASNLASCATSAVVWILHGRSARLGAGDPASLACLIAGNYLGAPCHPRRQQKIRSVMFLVLEPAVH